MSDKHPQPTAVLVTRLQRVANCCDVEAARCQAAADLCVDEPRHAKNATTWRARANTCWQAAARLEELTTALEQLAAQQPGRVAW